MPRPYRDENESLRAELARLKGERASRRVTHGKLAVMLVAVDFVAILVLRPWLNGKSDALFWFGAVTVGSIALGALASAFGFRR